MRNLLVKEDVTLTSLKLVYVGDHGVDEILFSCNSDMVNGTGRRASKKQLISILTVIGQPISSEEIVKNRNLLSDERECTLIFSDNILVAIANKELTAVCNLETGEIVSEDELFKFCKEKKKERILSQIEFHKKRINELEAQKAEVDSLKF